MENQEAINYLENLERGMFCTVNIPLYNKEKIPITVMYIGKDKDGRYNFADTGIIVMSKDFIEQKSISVDKEFDREKAMEIHSKIRMQSARKKNRVKER